MNKYLLTITGLIFWWVFGFASGALSANYSPTVSVLFPPDDNARIAMVKEIQSAEKTIHLEAYSFTNPELIDALIQAHQSGKEVSLIIDADYAKNSTLVRQLAASGVQVWLDNWHSIMHSKIVIIDEKIVFTGSSNLTKAGLEPNGNAENSLRIDDEQIASQYEKNWQYHRSHSKELKQ